MNRIYMAIYCLMLAALFSGCQAKAEGEGLTAHAAPASESIGKTAVLGEFSTEFKGATNARAHNITLASKAIDQKVVPAGESFSFNDAVGPTNKARGYMLGRIFVNGKDAKGYGGGVCQVSSTLYNAVLKAGLQVVERHEHSKPVGYVEKGRDATTSYGVRDFKFKNNTPNDIKINSAVSDETVKVTLESV